MKKIYQILALALLSTLNLLALDPNVLLKGVIKDDNGEFVGAKIKIIDESGKSSIGRSNTKDGKFDQILKPNKKYTFVIDGYVIDPASDAVIHAPNVSEYYEMNKSFKVKKIQEGMLITEFNAFPANSFEFNSSEKYQLDFVKEFIKSNIGANLEITLTTNDSQFSPIKEKKEVIVKGKKKMQTITVSGEEQLQKLSADRITAIKSTFESANIPTRNITFIEKIDKSTVKKSSKTKTKTIDSTPEKNDLKVIINKLLKF